MALHFSLSLILAQVELDLPGSWSFLCSKSKGIQVWFISISMVRAVDSKLQSERARERAREVRYAKLERIQFVISMVNRAQVADNLQSWVFCLSVYETWCLLLSSQIKEAKPVVNTPSDIKSLWLSTVINVRFKGNSLISEISPFELVWYSTVVLGAPSRWSSLLTQMTL